MAEIDLHGVKHEQVSNLLDRFIWDSMRRGLTSIDIITGNSEAMKTIVKDVLSEYELVAENSITNTGMLLVNLI